MSGTNRRALQVWGMVAVLVGWASGMSRAEPPAAPAPPKELRVGIAPILPPFAFKKGDELTGLEADFARKLGSALGATVHFVELPWDGLIPALRDNKVDVVMSGMSITKERAHKVAFTTPYLRVGQMALVRKDDINRLGRDDAMRAPGMRIGFLGKTTGEQFARRELPHAKHSAFASVDDGVAALRNKQIDFLIVDAPTVWQLRGPLREQNEDLLGRYRLLTQENLAWAVRPTDRALLDLLNRQLATWEDDGTLESTLDVWMPVRKVTVDGKR